MQSSLLLAGQWFLSSGIQEPEGGVARYYLSSLRRNARVSTEITGYSISALVYLAEQTGNIVYLDAAKTAGRFLCRQAWDSKLAIFPFEHAIDGEQPRELTYFFDSGIIARGLLTLWRATHEDEFLQTARACGESMLADFMRSATVHPILSLPSKDPLPHAGNWSRNPGCYQLKAAMAWQELYEISGEQHFLDAYENVLASSLASHSSFLPGEQDSNMVMDRLHAYSYFLEGMLPCYDRPECQQAVCIGLASVAHFLREISPAFERSDVCAQLLRARLYAAKLGACPLDKSAAEEEVHRMQAFQFEHTDPRIHGGFWFGRKQGEMMPYVNPVSTAFCLQSLEMWRQFESDTFKANRYELI